MTNLRDNPLYHFISIATYILLTLAILACFCSQSIISGNMLGELLYVFIFFWFEVLFYVLLTILIIYYLIRRKVLKNRQPSIFIDIGMLLSLLNLCALPLFIIILRILTHNY